jgi:hypothetical protein
MSKRAGIDNGWGWGSAGRGREFGKGPTDTWKEARRIRAERSLLLRCSLQSCRQNNVELCLGWCCYLCHGRIEGDTNVDGFSGMLGTVPEHKR